VERRIIFKCTLKKKDRGVAWIVIPVAGFCDNDTETSNSKKKNAGNF
jgi:hypothetical protein